MTAPVDPALMPDAVERYVAGESVAELARVFDISRTAVRRHLVKSGVAMRTIGEQADLVNKQRGAEWRRARVAAAHASKRGRPPREESLVLAAETRGKRGPGSRGEEKMLGWLKQRGEEPGVQTPVGRYNIDFTVASVAVEFLGGEWHRYKRTHGVRTKALLDAGWHVLFVWDVTNYPVTSKAADYAVAFAKEARRNPTAAREYRVIRGDGELVARGRLKDYEMPAIPAARSGMSRSEVGRLGAAARWGNKSR